MCRTLRRRSVSEYRRPDFSQDNRREVSNKKEGSNELIRIDLGFKVKNRDSWPPATDQNSGGYNCTTFWEEGVGQDSLHSRAGCSKMSTSFDSQSPESQNNMSSSLLLVKNILEAQILVLPKRSKKNWPVYAKLVQKKPPEIVSSKSLSKPLGPWVAYYRIYRIAEKNGNTWDQNQQVNK